jgi:putative transcriptional regulator
MRYDKISAIRKKLGLTQGQFADRFSLNVRTLQNWECGRYALDAAHAALFCAIAREPETMARLLAPEATTS